MRVRINMKFVETLWHSKKSKMIFAFTRGYSRNEMNRAPYGHQIAKTKKSTPIYVDAASSNQLYFLA